MVNLGSELYGENQTEFAKRDAFVIINTIGSDDLSDYYYHYRDPILKEAFANFYKFW